MADTSRLGRYQIKREIARSNDIVYEATDTLIGRRVALKELALPPNLVGQAKRERVERFYREARAAGALTHKNIVTVFEVGEDHGRHFIAMEYLEGQTLRQLLDLNGAMPVAQAKDLLIQVLDALAFAHSNGVIHRDIKPDNIYLLPDNTVKLTDFGIARIMDEPSLTGAGQVFGTPSYMSAEQIAGKPMDERTDLYSTGVMAYEMVAGRKPFVGENLVALTYQILSVEPESPRGIPMEFAAVIQKAMAKDPAFRYQSARQMADALKNLGTVSTGTTQGFAATTWMNPNAPPVAMPDPHLIPGGFPIQAQVPTVPPAGFPRQRFVLTPGVRQFLMAVAAGILVGSALVAAFIGVRGAYQKYDQSMRERAAMTVYMAGKRAYDQQRFPEAIRQFQIVARSAAGTPLAKEAVHAIVQSYLNLGDMEADRNIFAAKQYYEYALQTDKTNAESYLRYGSVMERLGHYDDAMNAWQQAETLDGFGEIAAQARKLESTAWYNRGVNEYNVGNRELARQYWEKAIAADPGGTIAARAQRSIHELFLSSSPNY
jgi:serine/threonine-protein kinase